MTQPTTTLHARVHHLTEDHYGKPLMTLVIEGCPPGYNVLRLRRQEGVKLGDSFVVVLSKVEMEAVR